MVSKKEALNSSGDIVIMRTKDIRCWYCQLHGKNILDEFGCCKRCGTNLKKYPNRDSHMYPELNTEKVSQEVLGTREKFNLPDDNDQGDW